MPRAQVWTSPIRVRKTRNKLQHTLLILTPSQCISFAQLSSLHVNLIHIVNDTQEKTCWPSPNQGFSFSSHWKMKVFWKLFSTSAQWRFFLSIQLIAFQKRFMMRVFHGQWCVPTSTMLHCLFASNESSDVTLDTSWCWELSISSNHDRKRFWRWIPSCEMLQMGVCWTMKLTTWKQGELESLVSEIGWLSENRKAI
jgi:hypothetical protein